MIQKTMVWDALLSLKKAEEKAFVKFIRSPYYNQREELAQLLTYLLACKNKDKLPDTMSGWAIIFPEQSYNDQKMRLINSDLLKLLEQFLLDQEQELETARNRSLLAKAFLKRGLSKHFGIALREAQEYNEAQAFRHEGYYTNALHIGWLQYQQKSAESRTGEFNLQLLSDLIDHGYLIQKLRIACLQYSHAQVFSTHYQYSTLPFVLQHIAQNQLDEIPEIGLYYYCYRFLSQPEAEEHFQKFSGILKASADRFPTEDQRTLYLLAINYAIKKVNSGREDWYKETLSLYQNALNRNLLLENGLISRFAFNNIVAIALRTGESEWASEFIVRHNAFLEKKHRSSIVSLNQARIAYANKEYDQVLEGLQKADYKDLLNNLIAKTLLLKVYYETNAFPALESHLASMRIFIQRHKTLGYHQQNYQKIIKYTQLLMQAQEPAQKSHLRNMIDADQALLEKEWFLQMLA